MSLTNHALWLPAERSSTMTVSEAPYPTPAAEELIIRTTAVAINPADWILQRTGALLSTYPAILGCDAAGIVHAVGTSLVGNFSIGDRVFAATNLLEGYRNAAFQEYVAVQAPCVAKVPVGVKDEDAVVLPLGMNTAASCLFALETLGLVGPWDDRCGENSGKVVVVWGASSSVGCCAVQLATAAGFDVFAVASTRNFEMVKGVGARECFDYADRDVVEKVVGAMKRRNVVGGVDAISSEETIGKICEILAKVDDGARKLVACVKPEAEKLAKDDVEVRTNFGVDQVAFRRAVSEGLWKQFLPAALEAGHIQCKPDAQIEGQGLGDIQAAVDLLADKGVSARKLVVKL